MTSACTTDDGARRADDAADSGAAPSTAPARDLAADYCSDRALLVEAGVVESDAFDELSGLASSARPNTLWAVSDSGDPVVHAFDFTGATLGKVAVTDARLYDWEDLARGPSPAGDGSALYIGDIGDNGPSREIIRIIVIAEPAPGATTAAPIATVVATYPDGPRDAEAMFVDPASGDVYLIEKSLGPSAGLYRLAAADVTAGVSVELTRVGEVRLGGLLGLATSADISPDGSTIAIRTYTNVFVYARDVTGESIVDALGHEPCETRAPDERQGEAIAFADDGLALFSAPEGAQPRLTRIDAD